jgi:hypothetical protein
MFKNHRSRNTFEEQLLRLLDARAREEAKRCPALRGQRGGKRPRHYPPMHSLKPQKLPCRRKS